MRSPTGKVLSLFLLVAAQACRTDDERLVRHVIIDVRDSSYGAAAAAFHMPSTESKPDQEREREFVQRGLAILHDEFGGFGEAEALAAEPKALTVGIETGDAAYWQNKRDVKRRMYRVRFERIGDGYLLVDLTSVTGKSEIRRVAYGISADNGEQLIVLRRAAKRLSSLLDQLKEQPQPSKSVALSRTLAEALSWHL